MTHSHPYSERFRPQFHFTARQNWLNDPNGCVFHDGEYHLCFQHNPSGLKWGNMTWGHAVSTDLVHWRQLPHAITPYDGGAIFSGSAVVDAANSSGFARDNSPPLVAAFTHARKPFGQALAFSLDRGRTWMLHDRGRPVVPNQGLDESERDPKLLWHEPSRRWIMALWVRRGQARFFASTDLKHWMHTGDFHGEDFYECPDGNADNRKWVLLDGAFRYWIGAFDGRRFAAEAGPFPGDRGAHFYAAQTWSNTGNRVVQIAWMKGGAYPRMPFNQQMSFPCELSLRSTADGIRLCRAPVREIEGLRAGAHSAADRILRAGETLEIGPRGDLFDIAADIEAAPDAAFAFRMHDVDVAVSDGRIRCLGKEAPLAPRGRAVELRILLDRTSIELFANGGEIGMSSCFLPHSPHTAIRLRADRGTIRARRIEVHALRTAWNREAAPPGPDTEDA